MTAFVEAILPDETLGIERTYRTEDSQCAYCGGNLPPRHWVVDLVTGYLERATQRGTLTRVSLESQLRAHCCAEHAALDLDPFLGQYGIRRSKLYAALIAPCGRCGELIFRGEEHHSIWAADIADDQDESFEQHCHAVICRACVGQLGAPGDDRSSIHY